MINRIWKNSISLILHDIALSEVLVYAMYLGYTYVDLELILEDNSPDDFRTFSDVLFSKILKY